MILTDFLFSFTFVFGVIYLVTLTKIFNHHLVTFTEAFTIKTPKYLKLLGVWVFYLSLFYQSFFWAKFFNILN